MAAFLLLNDQLVIFLLTIFVAFRFAVGTDLFYDWHVALDDDIRPISISQPVITINGLFPGPLINATTNDVIHVNVFNGIDEPLLITWNGIQQRLNSWQDGVSGTNCPINPGKNYTYVFQVKDQIGTFFYFPSINFQKAAGGFGPIQVNNRKTIKTPFPKPEAEFDLLVGDWYQTSYKAIRSTIKSAYKAMAFDVLPDIILMNGKGPYLDNLTKAYESFTVTKGKTYMIRISNVGVTWSFNFRIQNHTLTVVETEGSYTQQIKVNDLDVHVGQSYTVLVTADQNPTSDYFMVASPKMHSADDTVRYGVGVFRYANSTYVPRGSLPKGPDPFDIDYSVQQAMSIRWNLTSGAARPNPQGLFNVHNITLTQNFILRASTALINNLPCYTVNNVSYYAPKTPLKLADQFLNNTKMFKLDKYPTNTTYDIAVKDVFVASGIHRGWIELVFQNEIDVIDSWHLDGFSFYVVGFGIGQWTPDDRYSYNILDPVVRSTVQVYPGQWTAVYAYLDNPGMWNLRSQHLKNWYLGEELYLRVFDPDFGPNKEKPVPQNLLYCGDVEPPPPPPTPSPETSEMISGASHLQTSRFHIFTICIAACSYLLSILQISLKR